MLDGHVVAPCGMLLERALLDGRKLGVNLGAWAEIDLWLRIAEGGIRWGACPAVVGMRARPGLRSEGADWASLASQAEGALRRSYRRAAAHGWDERELTEEREQTAVATWRLAIATLAALEDDDERMSTATEIMRTAAKEGSIEPHAAAEAALWALRTAPGVRPEIDGKAEARWAPVLGRWLSRCVSERWAKPALTSDGVMELAELMVPNEAVAGSMLEQLGMPGTLLISGASAESFALGDAAAAKGWDVALVMPGGAAGARSIMPLVLASGEKFSVVGPERTKEQRDPLVMTPEGEMQAMELSAGRPNVIRWSGTRRGLVEKGLGRLRGSWGGRG
jgi:hypothetical protein